MSLINPPSNQPIDTLAKDAQGNYSLAAINQGWMTFLNAVFQLLNGMTQSGLTSKRPKPMWIGQPFFDTSLGSLGKPIWVARDGKTWVDSTGSPS